MKLVESYLTKNPCYTNNVNKADSRYTSFQANGPQGLMLHSVGCNQPSASVFVKNWNSASCTSKCVHAFIDANSGDIYQTLPWNYRGWHAGTGTAGSAKSANNTHVGVEMCEPSQITYTSGSSFAVSDKAAAQAAAKKTYDAAVELFAYLCNLYGLNPTADGVIISHAEGYKRGVASNHGDPQHLWTGLGLSYTMDTFRAAVKAAMASSNTDANSASSGASSASSGASSASTISASSLPSTPFTVQVLVSDLNIRTKASTSSVSKGYTGKGTFTITKVDGGWGYLKSGAGWIYLLNTKYVTVGKTVSETYAVGDKVIVNGTIYGTGKGGGGKVTKSKATMYVKELTDANTYPYYIGLSAKKGGTRQGWGEPSILTKA